MPRRSVCPRKSTGSFRPPARTGGFSDAARLGTLSRPAGPNGSTRSGCGTSGRTIQDITKEDLERIRSLMNEALPGASVTGHVRIESKTSRSPTQAIATSWRPRSTPRQTASSRSTSGTFQRSSLRLGAQKPRGRTNSSQVYSTRCPIGSSMWPPPAAGLCAVPRKPPRSTSGSYVAVDWRRRPGY